MHADFRTNHDSVMTCVMRIKRNDDEQYSALSTYSFPFLDSVSRHIPRLPFTMCLRRVTSIILASRLT